LTIDPKICVTWDYLISAKESEILSLPTYPFDSIDDLPICQEAKYLIGWWLNKGSAQPCKSPSSWMRSGLRPKSYWGNEIRERIAYQVDSIRHWTIINDNYSSILPNMNATWFIDPPYQFAGRCYKYGSKLLNYNSLANWCLERKGQTIVCENSGATWLPFVNIGSIKSSPGAYNYSEESMYLQNKTSFS
jgi:hypothetical protein